MAKIRSLDERIREARDRLKRLEIKKKIQDMVSQERAMRRRSGGRR